MKGRVFNWVQMVGQTYYQPVVNNPRSFIVILVLMTGGSVYGILSAFGVDIFPDREVVESPALSSIPRASEIVPPFAETVKELPYADGDHEHDDYALRGHTHTQRNWVPIIKKSKEQVKEELYEEYHK